LLSLPEYRVFVEHNGNVVSSVHDIPLFCDAVQSTMNMVVEIPRWTNAKMKASMSESFSPMHQSVRRGKLRYVV
jgi:inorganic pyrophosphatase